MRKSRLALLAAIASVAGFVAWLSLSDPGRPPAPPPLAAAPASADPEPTGGSAVPCAVPLTWRIAYIDTRFELTDAQATAAVERAAASWERATGRTLFVHDRRDGMPIQFV